MTMKKLQEIEDVYRVLKYEPGGARLLNIKFRSQVEVK